MMYGIINVYLNVKKIKLNNEVETYKFINKKDYNNIN